MTLNLLPLQIHLFFWTVTRIDDASTLYLIVVILLNIVPDILVAGVGVQTSTAPDIN